MLKYLRLIGMGVALAALVAVASTWNASGPLKAQPFVPAGGPFQVFPAGTIISGNAAGTTAAVVGTLAASAGKFTYICGFNVNAIGGVATVGPITVAGLIGSSQVYQTDVNSATVGKQVAGANYNPCIPASAVNTAITVTTTANGTATAVNVNSWGYQL
jgi:hypothetical protein